MTAPILMNKLKWEIRAVVIYIESLDENDGRSFV